MFRRICNLTTTVFALLLTSLILLGGARAADTQTILHTFTGGQDGSDPGLGLTLDAAGNLYGTTYFGQVFKLTPENGSWQYNVLYSFGVGGEDNTWGPTLDAAGNLYGTTSRDGNSGHGIVFELKHSSSGWTKKVLHAFSADSYPYGSVIFDKLGNLYGTAQKENGDAIVFELTPSREKWVLKVLHTFTGGYGSGPNPDLVFDAQGNLYGTTYSGGSYGAGSVFELHPSKTGWTETVIYSFTGGNDGKYPVGGEGVIFDRKGRLYGGTVYGGTDGGGVVFQLTRQQDGQWVESVLDNFHCIPQSLVFDSAGNLYGATTSIKGSKCGQGSVFQLTPLKDGQWRENVLYDFSGSDGWGPQNLVLDDAGNLYGATVAGGSDGLGLIYELMP